MSFIEHQVHQRLMHRRNYLSERSAKYKRVFEAHAIVHHKHYSKIFHDEPVPPGEDEEIRLTVEKAPIKALPVALLIAPFSLKGALAFVGVMTFHHWTWNKIHLEMHKPEQRSFHKWPIYRFLARYHWLHHRYPDKNFNVVFPLADYVLGTCAKATPADEAAMIEEFDTCCATPAAHSLKQAVAQNAASGDLSDGKTTISLKQDSPVVDNLAPQNQVLNSVSI
jgi:hypothetical protein